MLYDALGGPFLGTDSERFVRVLKDGHDSGIPRGSNDSPFLGFLGSGAFGDINGDGAPEYVAPTAGIRALLDIALPGSQETSDFQVAAWNPLANACLPLFPWSWMTCPS